MSFLYIEKIPTSIRNSFAQKVAAIASFLSIHPDWLMQVMYAESKLKSTAANRQGTDKHLVAAGLLQFTSGSGIVKAGKVASIAQILTMPALDQLDLVKWYLSPYRNRMKSYYDVYAVTFFPSMIGKPDDWVLQTKSLSAGTIARQNKGMAKGKSFITVADFKHYAVNLVPKSLRERVFGVMQQAIQTAEDEVTKAADAIKNHPKESAGVGTGIIIGICLLGWFFIRKG